MYVAYSAISAATNAPSHNLQPEPQNERLLRYQAYQATCEKFSAEIAAIKKYIPGWKPVFRP